MNPIETVTRQRATALVAALVVVIAFAYWRQRIALPVPAQPVGRWNGDLYNIYVPVHAFAYGSRPLLPSWNPYQLAGSPFVAGYNGGFFYPPNFLSALLPVHRALGWESALHVALAALFMVLCGRALGLSAPGSALAALCFMMNSWFLLERIHPSYLAGLAWIPAVFLCAGRVVERPGAAPGAVLGLVLAAQFLAGHAQIVCYEAYALLAVVLPWIVVRRAARGWSVAGGFAVAVVIAVLVSAIQLLPTLEVVLRSTRGPRGLTLAQTQPGTWSLSGLRDAVFASGPGVVLASAALVDRSRRSVVGVGVLLVAFAALFGLGTPLYTRLFYFLPGVALFRLPQTMIHLGTCALGLLAGIGLDQLLVRRGRTRARLVGVVLAWLVVAVVLAERWSQVNTLMMPQHNEADFFRAPPLVDFLRTTVGDGRVLVIKNWASRFPIMEKLGTLYRLPTVQDYEPLAPAAYHEFLRPLEAANTDQPLFWGRFFPSATDPGWPLLDLLAVRWVVVAPGAHWGGDGGARFARVYAGRDGEVYENRLVRPRAFLATAHRVIADPEDGLRAVQARSSAEARAVVVDREVVWRAGNAAAVEEDVSMTAARPNTVEVHVTTPRPALLVVADLYWPGWRADIDGERRDIVRVDYLFRGVAVEPGVHVVRFSYRPWILAAGRAITTATVAGLLLAAAIRRGRG